MCHLVFVAPVLALPVFWLLPVSVAGPIYGGILALTGLLLWPTARALLRPQVTGGEGMIGIRGEALTELNPHGLVRCQGEVWAATADGVLPAGQLVQVVAVDRLHLRVKRNGPEVTRTPDTYSV